MNVYSCKGKYMHFGRAVMLDGFDLLMLKNNDVNVFLFSRECPCIFHKLHVIRCR